MNINRRSWHYRLRGWVEIFDNDNVSLCKYFWQMMFVPILLLIAGVAAIVVSPILLIKWLLDNHRPKWDRDLSLDSTFGDVVGEFVRARYRNVCPLIKFKD